MAYRSCRQRDLGTSGRVASAAAAPAGLGRGGFRGVGEGFRVRALGVGGEPATESLHSLPLNPNLNPRIPACNP